MTSCDSLTIPRPRVPAVQCVRFHPVLVDVSMVMLARYVDSDTVYRMAEAGELRWVWDVGCGDKVERIVRTLRFWLSEVIAPENARRFKTHEVIERVIGHPTEQRLRAVTVGNILLLRRPSIQELVSCGHLVGPIEDHTQWITRDSLRLFLEKRLQ